MSNVFDDRTLAALTGTSPSATPATRPPGPAPGATPSPSTATSATTPFALGHNGNLTNTEELAAEAGMLPGTVTSDSDLVAELIARELGRQPRRPAPTAGPSSGR